MKTRILFLSIIISAFILISCDNDDETISKPRTDSFELGLENSKIGYAGSDLHIEAEVVAEGKIDIITVEIHFEGEQADEHTGWEFDSTYTKFSGDKNNTFHEHVDIPVTADTGSYQFYFIITDMEGNQTTIEEEFEVQQPDDDVAPEMTISAAPSNNQTFTNNETISISGSVSDEQALGGMYIGLVRDDQNLTDAEVNATNTITILHTHDFESPASHNFSASITVGAVMDNNITPKEITGDIAWQSANYYILVKCKDAFGGNWTFSSHYPVIINY